ncbi:hypothetical protein K440DRAFT_681461 [Wilcoxina mikolae CBS 423.85]|nr:hypothetical protein K440DRAFT_681461 [Wilcoxina mikolae CBS 423.85]
MLLRTVNAAINFMDALSLPPTFRRFFKRTATDERCVTRQNIKQPKRQGLMANINEGWKLRAAVIRWWLVVRSLGKRLVAISHRRDSKEMQWTGKARERLIAATITALLHINSIGQRWHMWVGISKERGIATTITVLLGANRIEQWCQKKFFSLRISFKMNVIATTITILLGTNKTAQRYRKKFRIWRIWLKMTTIAMAITILLGTNKIALRRQKKLRLWRIWLKIAVIAAIITALLHVNNITQWGRKTFWSLRIGLKTALIAGTINILLGTNRIAQWCQRKFRSWGILLETSAISAIITILLTINSAVESVLSYGKSMSAAISSYWFRVIEPWILARTISALLAVQWILSAVQKLFSRDRATFLAITATTSGARTTARNATTTASATSFSTSSPLAPASAFFASVATALAAKVSTVKDALVRAPHLLPLYHERRSKHQSMYSLYMVFITSHRLERSRSDRSARLVDAALYS